MVVINRLLARKVDSVDYMNSKVYYCLLLFIIVYYCLLLFFPCIVVIHLGDSV
jgi:hypothetical protein